MQKEPHAPLSPRAPLFGNPRILCAAGLLAAIAIVLNRLSIPITFTLRFGFGNLPILMAGIFFGPVIGGAVGVVSDLMGCVLRGDPINPIITLGAALVGVASGLLVRLATRRGRPLKPLTICLSVMLGHITGSLVVKSIGMAIYYGTPLPSLLWRIPLYIVTGAVEAVILVLLFRNKIFMGQLSRLLYRKKGRKQP